jgi:uncharacterized protein YheU (UPF0270 family)
MSASCSPASLTLNEGSDVGDRETAVLQSNIASARAKLFDGVTVVVAMSFLKIDPGAVS